MNENRFVSERTHTRVKFQPLRTSCELECLTPQSPAAQTVDVTGSSPSYVPNRAATPTVIYPDVRGLDPDGIFHHGPANQYLGVVQWYVNNEPIEDVWTENTDYVINTSETDMRGALTVYKNLPVGEDVVLTFHGEFLDWRTGIAYQADSAQGMALTTTEKGEDKYGCSVDKPLITYDPLYDNLLLYDYKVGRGIPVIGTRADYIDGHAFEQTVKVLLTKGVTNLDTLPTGVTMRIVRLGSDTGLTPNTIGSPELTYATYPYIKFDMRLINKNDYEVQFILNNTIIARESLGLATEVTMPFEGKAVRASDIAASQVVYENHILLRLPDRVIDYPELYYSILWYTQAKIYDSGSYVPAAAKAWQRGHNLLVNVADLGIGLTKNDSYFDLWFEVDPHKTCEVLLEDDGVTPYYDTDNSFLIE